METSFNQNNIIQETPSKNKFMVPLLVSGILLLLLSAICFGYNLYLKSIENEKLKKSYEELSKSFEISNNQTDETSSSYFDSSEEELFVYFNTDIGYEIYYPSGLVFDKATNSFSGEILGDDKIFIEVSTNSISSCIKDCDVLKKIGSIQINNLPTSIYFGTKSKNIDKLNDVYLTYEIANEDRYAYISYQMSSTNLTIEQIGLFTKVATSFKFRPDLVDTSSDKNALMELPMAGKPVIYLYPNSIQNVNVKLNYNGKLIATYPKYQDQGWSVQAFPNGKLINYVDDKEYSYLFWEGENYWKFSEITKGFVVAGDDTALFLQEKLAQIGLSPKEYNEFIVYWLPLMQNNKYNLIHFAQEEYTENAELIIVPKPDSMLRVFMIYKSLDNPIKIQPQFFETFKRKGFSVVEWGGTKL